MSDPLPPASPASADTDYLSHRPPRPKYWLYALAVIFIAVCAILGVLLYNASEKLSGEGLESARRRWKAAGIRDYNIDIIVGGLTQGEYHIEVRKGEVTADSTYNKKPFENLNLARAWTVDALLDEILPQQLEEGKGNPNCFAAVQYDDQLGYPQTYMKTIDGKQSNFRAIVQTDLTKAPGMASGLTRPNRPFGRQGQSPRGGNATRATSSESRPSRPADSAPSKPAPSKSGENSR